MKNSGKHSARLGIGIWFVAVLGTVPAVAGYSNSSKDELATAGIVTDLKGKAWALSEKAGTASEKKAAALEDRSTLVSGQKVWVEEGGLLKVHSITGGISIVAGPSVVEFVSGDTLKVYQGAAKLLSVDGTTQYFESTFMSGSVSGVGSECAVWTSEKLTQVMGIEGDTRVWHPRLHDAIVALKEGYFTESTAKQRYLQPRKPQEVEIAAGKKFLAVFSPEHEAPKKEYLAEKPKVEKEEDPGDDYEAVLKRAQTHKSFAIDQDSKPASRVPASVIEKDTKAGNLSAAEVADIMNSHLSGRSIGGEDGVLRAPASQRSKKPSYTVIRGGKKLGGSDQGLVERLERDRKGE